MKEKNILDKVKKLSECSIMGVDVTGITDIKEIYDRDYYARFEETIEGEYITELRNGVDGERASRFFDLLASVIGTRRAEGIRDQLLSRIGYYENASREKFDEKKRVVDIFQEKVELISDDDKNGMHDVTEELRKTPDIYYEDTSNFMRRVSDDLFEEIEAVEKNYRDKSLSELVDDITQKYKLRMNRIYEGYHQEADELEKAIDDMKKEVEEEVKPNLSR